MKKVKQLIGNILSKGKYANTSHADIIGKAKTKSVLPEQVSANRIQSAKPKRYVYSNEKMKGSRHDTWKALHPDEHLIGDTGNRHVEDKVILLVGEIIRGGIAEYGIKWLDSNTGKYWCRITNTNPSYIKLQINNGAKPLRPSMSRK